MKPRKRSGIVSLPVAIFFIALVVAAGLATDMIASGQTGLSNTQLNAESAVAARQAELRGLTATQEGDMLQLTQTSGVETSIVAAIVQSSGETPVAVQVSYAVAPGQPTLVNVTQVVQSLLGGQIPASGNLTLVTGRGLYITSPFQTSTQVRRVTTYQQEQVQETGQRLAGYDVSETTNQLVGYNVIETTTTDQLIGYDVTARYAVTTQVLSGYNLYMTVAHTTYTCPSGWTNAGNGLCYTYTTGTPYQTTNPPPNADIIGSTTKYKTVWWGYYCAVFGIGCWSAPYCHFGAIWCWPVSTPYTVYTVAPLVKTYTSATATTTYTQQYEGFSSSCPSYAYQLGIKCNPVYTTQTSYRTESLGQLSYCPSSFMNRYTGIFVTYSCSPVYHQQTTTTGLGQLSYCPSGSSGTQYSCTPVYQSRTTNLGEMSYCPSGSQYSCSAVYSSYVYWVTETVPVVTTVNYETLSTLGSTWLIGG